MEERFRAKVSTGNLYGCRLWTGALYPSGYGAFGVTTGQPPTGAHRVAWELAHGPIPDGLFVCHHCDIHYPLGDRTYRRCVNHEHLWLGTHEDNMADMVAKGRHVPRRPDRA